MSYSPQKGMVSTLEFLSKLRDYPAIRTKKNIEYLNVPAAFDIETSSFYNRSKAILHVHLDVWHR